MPLEHDFKKFPELVGESLDQFGWSSPHLQIFDDFSAKVTKVKDGDTINVNWSLRNFDFPVRFLNIAAPELSEGGKASKKWLEAAILGENVDIEIDAKNRVGKWGRLLGIIKHKGIDIGEASILAGHSVAWAQRNDMRSPEIKADFEVKWP